MMKISSAGYSEIGGRENNEDAFGVFETEAGKLLVVADGLGGHEHGEVASRAALDVVRQNVGGMLSKQHLQQAMELANAEVLRLAQNMRMNTTLAVLWLQGDRALAATAGDTRIYQFRNGQIQFQSRDHSLAQLDVIAGAEGGTDIRHNPDRNKLIRVVGMREGFKADITELQCRPGDAFLLCSDGFWEDVMEQEMLRSCQNKQTAAAWLDEMRTVLKPRLTPSSDNNTAVAAMIF